MQIIISLIFITLVGFIIYQILSNKISQKLNDSSLAREHQNRLNGLISVLDETVDQNITLVEAKILELKKYIDLANKKINVLEKEITNYEKGREQYNELLKKRPAISAIVDIEKNQAGTEHHYHANAEEVINFKLNNYENLTTTDQRTTTTQTQQHTTSEEAQEPSVQDGGERAIIALYREGKEANEIATELELPLASVELVLFMKFPQRK